MILNQAKKLMHLLRHGQHVHREEEELFNSGALKNFFRNISHIVFIGLRASGRKAWQEEEEETRKDISTVLVLQEQLCVSELFKVIQEAILLILLYRTM